jgi:glycine cleavage system H protein
MSKFKPENCFYTATHEWVSPVEQDVITVGITEHAQQLLGDIVYVELPEIGAQVAPGQELVVVESVKAAADVYGPVAGEVVAVNEELAAQPELINQSPQDKGWLFKMKLVDEGSLQGLLTMADYTKTVATTTK